MPERMASHFESRLQLGAPHDARGPRRASEWLAACAATHGIPAEPLERLDLFLNEALANVIDHGGSSARAAPIDLGCNVVRRRGQGEATITISDSGVPFDPLAHAPRAAPKSLDDAMPGGLGIPLMRSLADDMGYAFRENRNHLACTVRWLLAGPAEAGGCAEPGLSVHSCPPGGDFSSSHAHERFGVSWSQLFRGADEQAVLAVVNQCDVLELAPGTALLKPGVANDAVFVLLSGGLSACLDSDLNPAAAIPIAPGECIGEMSALDGKPTTALILATTEARVLKVEPELFFNRLLTIPGVARTVLVALTERMRRTNDSMLEAQREQLALQHLHKELEVARQLQASMLPRSPMFPEREDLEIAAVMEPASEVGGDLFDAFFVDDQHLFICIGDVSGHGIPAALFMARAVGLMRIAAMGTMRPEEVIAKINDQLCAGNDTSLFITLFCGFLNVSTGQLVYSNGGHCAPILIRGDKAQSIPIPKGALVGAIPGLSYSSLETVLEQDDILVCYTDGVTEAQPASGEEFSEERLIALLHRERHQPPEIMMQTVRREVTGFTGNNALEDDYTLMAIRRRPG